MSKSGATPRCVPVYFGAPALRSFGWYHGPTADVSRDCAVVLCPPLNHETTGVHRAFRYWAHALADAGFPTIRIDYHGTGDSGGDESDPDRLAAWISSIGAAADYARASSGAVKVALIGLRLGGTLALAAARARTDTAALVLWAAFPTGRAYLREARALSRLMATPTDPDGTPTVGNGEQLGGLTLTAQTVVDLTAFDPLGAGRPLEARVLLVPRDAAARETAFAAKLTEAGATVELRSIDGYASVWTDAHVSTVPSTLIADTTAWLSEHSAQQSATRVDSAEAMRADETLAVAAVDDSPDAPSGRDAPDAPDARQADNAPPTLIERPLHFGSNGRLFGLLVEPPAEANRKTAVLLLNSGSTTRVGPNRWYTSMSRRWAALGYSVLRMDFGGLGDSVAGPGDIENHPFSTNAVADVAAAVARLRELGAKRVVVGGGCSGALASFHAGLQLDGLDGLLIINPIVFYWKADDSLENTEARAYVEAQYYKRMARDWRAWARVLTGKVNFAYIARVGSVRAANLLRAKTTELVQRMGIGAPATEDAGRDLRRLVEKTRSVMLLFSQGDPGHDFITLNHARDLRDLEHAPNFAYRIIDRADHTFSSRDSRRRAESALTEHLLTHHA